MATITLYINADACPVKQEVYRVAERHARKDTTPGTHPVRRSMIKKEVSRRPLRGETRSLDHDPIESGNDVYRLSWSAKADHPVDAERSKSPDGTTITGCPA